MFSSQIIALDIGSLNTKIAVGTWNGKNLQISNVIMVPTPKDSFSDGYITNLKKLEDSLRPVLQENRLTKADVVFSAESTDIILREIVLPAVSEKELKVMIPFEVEKHFPVRVNDYSLEYETMGEFIEEGLKKIRLLVAAMPKEMVDNYLGLARGLNLKPLGLELQAGSITCLILKTGSVNGIHRNPSTASALIDIGHSKLRVTFAAQGRLSFSRTVAYKSKDLDETLAGAFDISIDKARELKKKGSLEARANRDPEEQKIYEVLQEKVEDWILEIQPLFRYYLGLSEENKIDQIILYGGYSEIKGLAEYIQEVFNRPTIAITKLDVITWTPKKTDLPLNYFLNAAGSLIQE